MNTMRPNKLTPDKLRIGLYGNLAASLSREVEDALLRKGVSCCVGGEVPADLKILCAWPDESGDPTMFVNAVNQFQAASASGQGMIVIEAPDPLSTGFSEGVLDAWNGHLKALADDLGAHFVPIRSKFLRWGPKECLAADFNPSKRGVKSIANAIAKLVVREQASASISDEDVTLTCARTGVSLRELLETDPAAADELLVSMCSPAAEVWPGFFWSDQAIHFNEVACEKHNHRDIEVMKSLTDGFAVFPARFGWPPVALGQDSRIDWAQTGPDRSWQSMFLALEFLAQPLGVVWRILSAGPAPPDVLSAVAADDALAKALQVFVDFQENNQPRASVTPRVWHEGTASRRLRALFALFSCCVLAHRKNLLTVDGTLARIGMEIVRTANLLSSDSIYIEAGNHGVRQDYGLYVVSRIFFGSVEAPKHRAIALSRLEQNQFRKCLSSDDVWLEHSAGYHGLVLDYLITMERIARWTGDTEGGGLLSAYISRMLRFFYFTLLPNKTFMMIGDTGSQLQERNARRAAKYETTTNCASVGMFPDAGYMICRPPNSEHDAGIHLAFYANLKSSKHKQADDLSIFLQEGLTPWLVDGGSINKETSDLRRNSARFDPGAHSTYRVNGGGYSFNRNTADAVGFIATHDHEDWCGACAVNRLYNGGEVTRFVVYMAQHRLIVVIDHLLANGNASAEFEQFWHLAPGTVITPRAGGFLAVQDGHPTHLNIAVDSAAHDSWDQWEGGDGQPLGWTMTGWNQVVPNLVLRRSFSSTNRWCVTAFQVSQMEISTISLETSITSGDMMMFTLELPAALLHFRANKAGSISIGDCDGT